MRKLIISLVILALLVTFGSKLSNAQSTVNLNLDKTVTVLFTPDGGGTVTLTESGGTGTTGGGTNLLTSASSFVLGGGTFTLTETGSGSNNYSISSGTMSLALNGGSLLTGTLNLLDFSQTPGFPLSTSAGTLIASLNITGGSACPAGGCSGLVLLSFQIGMPFTSSISSNAGSGMLFGGTVVAPTTDFSATPEPGTMVLFGSGLLALGGVLRRRKRSSLAA